jgi:hypothetical protein
LPQVQKQQPTASAELSVGYTTPQGRSGLREFWLAGPNVALTGLIHLTKVFSLGLGADFSILYFDAGAFVERWPGVALQERPNLFMSNISLHGVYSLFPEGETRPFMGIGLGFELIPRAVDQRIINGVRYTYYNVGGTNRLALGVAAGVNHELDDDFGAHVELKSIFIHNDPNVSFLLNVRAGLQYKF